MTPEESKQADFTLEAGWRMGLPEAFRPIAERYGKDAFIIAWAVGGIQEAVNNLTNKYPGNQFIQKCCFFIASGGSNLATYAMLHKEISQVQLAEIQRDMERAAILSGVSASGDGKGRIVLPS